jgi:hypothetical protein
VSGNCVRTTSSTVPGVAEHAINPYDAPRRAGQVVHRILLRRNIVIDEETAQLVAAAAPAALQVCTPSPPPRPRVGVYRSAPTLTTAWIEGRDTAPYWQLWSSVRPVASDLVIPDPGAVRRAPRQLTPEVGKQCGHSGRAAGP